ncbi:MAG: LLM class F420-dependent oxidoreductase [Acidimicrobiia bacterium]|nr:LLM class F420-dependent oxidoreductase [Acidimicrobiia bacterium]NNC75316.1 LLM class F420-dependent oxidoreductase [Acidimicrobiia bacterium]
MRFGAFVPQGWLLDLQGVPVSEQWPAITAAARTAESAGFDSVWVYDHFHTVPVPLQESLFEAYTVLAGLAASTSTVRLGQMCTSNSYRNPAYLAKVSSTIDVISGGRFILGIGAGWYDHEYRAYGYPFPKASVRIGQLGEAVRIIKKMWTEDEASFVGEHYRIEGAINQPKPVQEPHPEVWVAGGGEKLTLRIVAAEADYANFGDNIDVFLHKKAVLARHCEAIGRDPAEIGLSAVFDCLIAPTDREADRKLEWLFERWAHHDTPLGNFEWDEFTRRIIVGSPDTVTEQLVEWKAAGCDYGIMQFFETGTDVSGLDLFGRVVAPRLAE